VSRCRFGFGSIPVYRDQLEEALEESRWLSGGTVVKRFLDVSVASFLLLLALPLLLLAAVLVLVSSPGPVLFRQVRMGKDYRPFEILKLRTMRHGVDGLAYTLGRDPRITPIGELLRRTKLDELPQLWNVIRGDMSLVGPRPVLPELTYEFREFYIYLLRTRPGLTDPASLKYSQETRLLGQAEDAMEFFKAVVTPDKIRMSLKYMDRATLWTDLEMMAMTAAVCCFPALSRRYGEMPEVPAPVQARPRVPALVGLATDAPAMDGSIFSHRLAALEAEVQEPVKPGELPWIRLPDGDFESRSSPVAAEGGASRL
jgi:lipopolysaccharide/colanic/teichoic acid biosynthesis glycosyltransferase